MKILFEVFSMQRIGLLKTYNEVINHTQLTFCRCLLPGS